MIPCVTTLMVTVNGRMMDVLVNGLQANVPGLLTGSAVSRVRKINKIRKSIQSSVLLNKI